MLLVDLKNNYRKILRPAFILLVFSAFLSGCVSAVSPTPSARTMDQEFKILNQHISMNRTDEALSFADQLISRYPENPDPFYYRSMAHYLKHNYSMAVKDLDQAIRLNPENGNYFAQRALAYGKLNANEKSLSDFSQAIRLGLKKVISHFKPNGAPVFSSIYTDRARVYVALGFPDKGLQDMDQAITEHPGDPNLYLMRANFHLSAGNPEKALKDARESISLDSTVPQARNMEAIVLFYMGRYREALASYDKAVSMAESNPNTNPDTVSVFRGNRSIARWQSGMIAEAVEDALKAVDQPSGTFKDAAVAHYYFTLAYFMHESGKTEQARAYFRRSLELEPDLLKKRDSFFKKRYDLFHDNRIFYQKVLQVSQIYLGGAPAAGPVPAQPQDPAHGFQFTGLSVKPSRIPAGTPFDIHLSYGLNTPGRTQASEPIRFVFHIIRDEKTLFTSSPVIIQPDASGTGIWIQHMNPVTIKGTFEIRAVLQYQQMTLEKTAGFIIE
jgi:tetratricopeptide (TPR) repeat protein